MAADNDSGFARVTGLNHVEGLGSLGDRVKRKGQQQKKKHKKGNPGRAGHTIEEELAEEKGKEENKDGHVDFHA